MSRFVDLLRSLSQAESMVPDAPDREVLAAAVEIVERCAPNAPDVIFVNGYGEDPVATMIDELRDRLHSLADDIYAIAGDVETVKAHQQAATRARQAGRVEVTEP